MKVKVDISECLEKIAIKVAKGVVYDDPTWCPWLIGEPKLPEAMVEMKKGLEADE